MTQAHRTETGRSTMRVLVRTHVTESRWGHLLRYGGPGKASDAVEHLGEPIVGARYLRDTGRHAPPATKVLTASEESQLTAAVAASIPTVGSAIDDYVRALATACRRLSQVRSSAPRSTVSERVAVRVGRHYARTPDTTLDLDELVAEVVHSIERAGPLSKGAFCDRYAGSYAVAWEGRGSAACRAFPPESVLVGSNAPPRLSVGWPENWTAGTDRSVYGRYLLYFKRSALGAGESPRVHDPHGAAVLEIDRVCAPYGLADRVGRVVVASLASGVRVDHNGATDSESAGRVLNRWRAGEGIQSVPVDTDAALFDDDLVEAAGAYVAIWVIDTARAKRANEAFRTLVAQDELLARFVVRKVWMRLHGQERAEAGPPTRMNITFWLTSALSAGVWEGLAAYQRASQPDLDAEPTDLGERIARRRQRAHDDFVADHGESPDAFVDRTNRTLSLIAERPALARIVRELPASASEEYAVEMDHVAGPAWTGRYLTWAQVRSHLSAYLVGDTNADTSSARDEGSGA
ncbi:MAG: hypothetical protein V9F04_08330 [Dermatophilaceae bacterium]